jgi:hypothetical protein
MASFTIDTTEAIFGAAIRGSRQQAGDLQQLTLTITFWETSEWATLLSLVTQKYHVHSPLAGEPVIDIVRGPGEGVLVIDGLGSTSAILTTLDRSTYLPYGRSQGTAGFLVTGAPL